MAQAMIPLDKSFNTRSGKWHIGRGRFVCVSPYHKLPRIAFRQYQKNCGKNGIVDWYPSHPGISLHADQFRALVDLADDISQAANSSIKLLKKLGGKRYVSVHERSAKTYITLREWQEEEDGTPAKPCENSGIALSFFEWDTAQKWFPEASKEVTRIEKLISNSKMAKERMLKEEDEVLQSEIVKILKTPVGDIAPTLYVRPIPKRKQTFILVMVKQLQILINTQVTFVAQDPAKRKINEPNFKGLTPITNGYYEVEMFKRKLVYSLPIQIGLAVYMTSKLSLLRWKYEFFDKFISTADIQWCSTDTDSAYVALSGDLMDDVVRPELRDEYNMEKFKWMVDQADPVSRRKPGLIKVEQQGNGIVALAPKSYICYTIDDEGVITNTKKSTKGMSKDTNKFLVDHFKSVLFSKVPVSGFNVGIRKHPESKQPMSYIQQRQALSYYFIKRQVANDGISTMPLVI